MKQITIYIGIWLLSLLSAGYAGAQVCVPGSPGECSLSSFSDVGSKGISDPSIADTPLGATVYMAFSAVNASPMWPTQNPHTISTYIASSTDHGASWSHACTRINDITDIPGGTPRTWVNEVPTLVYDGFSAPSQRWKLFWHHYLIQNNTRQFSSGWIAYKAAPDPCSLSSAAEVKLFAGLGYDSANNTAGGPTGSPLGGVPVRQLNGLAPILLACAAFTEPGGIATAAGLYLSLNCAQPTGVSQTILLKCAAPCDPGKAGSWTYVGMPITHTDATNAGFLNYSASDIFAANGVYYLMVSSVTNAPFPNSYNNCQVFRFADINAGTLVRTAGTPTIIKQINGTSGTSNGACTYGQTADKAGFAHGEFSGITFRIYLTGIRLPG